MPILSLLSRLWGGSIRRQLILGIALVHAVLMTIFVFDLVTRQRAFLQEQSLVQAESLAETLAANSVSWVLAADVVGLEEVVRAQSRYSGLRYAMVLDPDGRVLGHSEKGYLGRYVTDPVSLSLLDGPGAKRTLVADETLIDVAVPIRANARVLGWSRVALDQTAINQGLAVVTRDGVIYTGIAIVVGTVFAFFMAGGMTRALSELVEVANATRSGRRDLRADSARQDEVGQVGRALDGMLDAVVASERALRESEERFDLAMRGASDGLWDWDLLCGRVYYSPRWKEMLGWDESEVGEGLEEFKHRVHPDDLAAVVAELEAYLGERIPRFERELRMRHRDGGWRWILTRGVAVRDPDGVAVRLVGTHVDITELKAAQRALFEETEKAQVTLASIADAVISTDEGGRVDYMNPVAERLTGWRMDEAKGRRLPEVLQLLEEESGTPLESPLMRCLAENRVVELSRQALVLNRDGEEIAVEDAAAPIHDAHGRLVGAVAVFHDVTQTRRLSRELSFHASHDALTGLINRREFEHRLAAAVHSASQERTEHSLAYIDLDQFKVVNDTCGHAAGDELLRRLTPLIGRAIRSGDTLARLGGDEFGILLEHCTLRDAKAVALKVLEAIQDFRFIWDEKIFSVGASIGLVAVTAATRSAPDALSAADAACYVAKEHGRNRIHVQGRHDVGVGALRGQMEWVSRIQEALEEDGFVLCCQPIEPITPLPGRERHYEVLVRMVAGEGETLPPGAFIPAAERYNLMPSVDRWVISRFLGWLARQEGMAADTIWCINLSGGSLGNEGFAEFIIDQLTHHQLSANRICFEVTETAAVANLDLATRFMGRLREHGCRFALDDFGSGMSSFVYLKNLPVDYLKIDGYFVRDIVGDPIDRAMVEAINTIGHTLGLETIAEFVEDEAILQTLHAMGVDYAQGYAISRPVPLESLEGENRGGSGDAQVGRVPG